MATGTAQNKDQITLELLAFWDADTLDHLMHRLHP